ncbi:hypothetical protein D9758_014719 [Tetrapyrgos nigripes]|uniref:NAD-dependent epimerase/dehydratase domain-containing protein n=1 Tax=Tetrapyrgos nigripes TaxID=182062 RepID=A0A8H5CAC8_9AGAR|nr:hypothetical protein D9758_014719 [Tetrapyrgos nigripes]
MPTVFVTGASGYIGFDIVHELLKAGYRVRGSARGSKLQGLKHALADVPEFEAFEIDDVSSADFTDAFKDVEAVIHTAAPVPARFDATTGLKAVVDGYLNIVQQAHKAGVKRIVVISSIVAFPNGGPFGIDDWNPVTEEDVSSAPGNVWALYFAQKKFGDQVILKYAQEHPEIDVIIFSLPWIFGPLRPGFHHILGPSSSGGQSLNEVYKSLTSVAYIYKLLNPHNTDFADPIVMDIRDVARLVLAAMKAGPAASSPKQNQINQNQTENDENEDQSQGRPQVKRFALLAPYFASYKDAVGYIGEVYPELKKQGRLMDEEKAPGVPEVLLQSGTQSGGGSAKMQIDWKRIEDVFGLKDLEKSCKTWKETVVDTVGSLLELEKDWGLDSGKEF